MGNERVRVRVREKESLRVCVCAFACAVLCTRFVIHRWQINVFTFIATLGSASVTLFVAVHRLCTSSVNDDVIRQKESRIDGKLRAIHTLTARRRVPARFFYHLKFGIQPASERALSACICIKNRQTRRERNQNE